ncbi:LysR family transcriptional regulator [Roseobacteraceae bacterium S113]
MNWDHLQTLVAVVREGSVSRGADALGVDQSTVSRRLQAFETQHGQTLFEGATSGGGLSRAGLRWYKAALRMEEEVRQVSEDLGAGHNACAGTVNVTATDFLSTCLLLRAAPTFLGKFPDINLRVRTHDQNIGKISDDIVISASNTPASDLVGRRLARATFASYAQTDYLAAHRRAPQGVAWLNWDEGSEHPVWPRLAAHIAPESCRVRMDSVPSLLEAVRGGLGATILPCFVGEPDPSLARVNEGEVVSHRDIWVLTKSELRNHVRIRALLDHMFEYVAGQKDLIESK